MMTTYHPSWGAVYAEAKLLLAGIVTVTSNVFVFCDARSPWRGQAITISHVGLLLIVKSKDYNAAIYNNHLFFLLITLSNAIKKIVVLLTSESSNNSIQ